MIYCLIGPSGCGKTTLAQNMKANMNNSVIISRDPIREMLFGYIPSNIHLYYSREDLGACEKIVSRHVDVLIDHYRDKDIILDNTHLKLKYINDLKKYQIPIKFILVETSLGEAIERDCYRARMVGREVINKQFKELDQLKKEFDFKDWVPAPLEPIIQTIEPYKPPAIVFDIDGTLALNESGRSPYDWKSVGNDVINTPVLQALLSHEERGYNIIILSGRDAVCRPETEKWLGDNGISYTELHMRKQGDQRKDSVVKEEFWRELVNRYYIVSMYDDRNQVVNHARKLGFTVFQVAEGNF